MKIGEKILTTLSSVHVEKEHEAFEICGYKENHDGAELLLIKNVLNGHNGNGAVVHGEGGDWIENPYGENRNFWFIEKKHAINLNDIQKLFKYQSKYSVKRYLKNRKLI